ncbi:hypothetical protein AA98_0408 [Escherichia coli 2-011-08_S1_C1]|nr:hypothetical protein AA98_0408 [Escherichia coli 2-011-08_S1_C1]
MIPAAYAALRGYGHKSKKKQAIGASCLMRRLPRLIRPTK